MVALGRGKEAEGVTKTGQGRGVGRECLGVPGPLETENNFCYTMQLYCLVGLHFTLSTALPKTVLPYSLLALLIIKLLSCFWHLIKNHCTATQ